MSHASLLTHYAKKVEVSREVLNTSGTHVLVISVTDENGSTISVKVFSNNRLVIEELE